MNKQILAYQNRPTRAIIDLANLRNNYKIVKTFIGEDVKVMGGINIEQIPEFIKYDIDITTSSMDKTTAISQTAVSLGKKAKVHIKIDTGMERLGVHRYNSERFIEETYNSEYIIVEGIFTHFAKSDNDKEFTEKQIKRFYKIRRK